MRDLKRRHEKSREEDEDEGCSARLHRGPIASTQERSSNERGMKIDASFGYP